MSITRIIVVLIAVIVAEFLGILLGRYVGFSQFAAVGVGLIPAMLLAFPLMKRWYGGRLSFTEWALTIAGMVVAATLIYTVIENIP